MTEFEVVKDKKKTTYYEVDSNAAATFTKEHVNEPGKPFLAPPGASTAAAEAEAIAKGEWQ